MNEHPPSKLQNASFGEQYNYWTLVREADSEWVVELNGLDKFGIHNYTKMLSTSIYGT